MFIKYMKLRERWAWVTCCYLIDTTGQKHGYLYTFNPKYRRAYDKYISLNTKLKAA